MGSHVGIRKCFKHGGKLQPHCIFDLLRNGRQQMELYRKSGVRKSTEPVCFAQQAAGKRGIPVTDHREIDDKRAALQFLAGHALDQLVDRMPGEEGLCCPFFIVEEEYLDNELTKTLHSCIDQRGITILRGSQIDRSSAPVPGRLLRADRIAALHSGDPVQKS